MKEHIKSISNEVVNAFRVIKSAINPYAIRLVKWLKNNAFTIISAIATIFILGTIGAYENRNISTAQFIFQLISGVATIAAAFFASAYFSLKAECENLLDEFEKDELQERINRIDRIVNDFEKGAEDFVSHR